MTDITIWKWGVNFGGRNNPDHYNFISAQSIVLGRTERCNYQPGDLVAVTSGHTVRAIAEVIGNPVSITERPDLEAQALEHEIEFVENTVIAQVEWKELEEPLYLPIDAGNRRVRKNEFREMIENNWNQN